MAPGYQLPVHVYPSGIIDIFADPLVMLFCRHIEQLEDNVVINRSKIPVEKRNDIYA